MVANLVCVQICFSRLHRHPQCVAVVEYFHLHRMVLSDSEVHGDLYVGYTSVNVNLFLYRRAVFVQIVRYTIQ